MQPSPTPSLSVCLTDEQLTARVDGLASAEEKERFESHLMECSACSDLAVAVRAASSAPGGSSMGPEAPMEARIGRYEILERIGAGAMGVVYAAYDPALDRKIALKVIRSQVAGPELEVRLLREAKAMARLVHPGVITVHDAGRDGERIFIAMELVDGGTLRDWQKERPRTWREIAHVYLRAGDGLAQAHAAGLVHRDFKPDNVLIGKDGRVRVTDFGLAREVGAEQGLPERIDEANALETTMNVPLTRTGAVVGTPAYMAPELLSGHVADARSDVYSFCVALYEALYGRRPFVGKTIREQLQERQIDVVPPALRSVPPRVRRVLAQGLRASSGDRYTSMRTVLGELGRATQWPFVAPTRMVWWAGGAALVIAVGAGLASKRAGRGGEAVRSVAAAPSIAVAVEALAGADARLACPIFQTRGVPDVGVRLGAAAAMLTCARESWELGGRDDRVLPPAALLDLPSQPADNFPDPYGAAEQRDRTLVTGRARAAAYVDGLVAHDRDSWSVELVLRARDDGEIARSSAADTTFLSAVRRAATSLWAPPLVERPLDPDIARWTSLPSPALGLLQADFDLFATASGCERIEEQVPAQLLPYFWRECAAFGASLAPLDAATPSLDETSPSALVLSVRTLGAWGIDPAPEQAHRAAEHLDGLRPGEPSAFGRGRLALTAGLLWSAANEPERARADLLSALREDPLLLEAWEVTVRPEGALPVPSAAAVASAWFPAEATFLAKAGSWRGDELEGRLRDARLAFVLDPRLLQALHLGRALAELGRVDDARAVAATPLESADANRVIHAYVLGFIDLHDAKLARAIQHLEDSGNPAMADLVVVAEVAGRSSDVATRWARNFLALPDAKAGSTARGYHAPMVLCMRAGSLARACLDRVEALGRSGRNWWYEGGTSLLEGARRYAAGDLRGAVSAWRSLVASENLEIVRLLPSEAFDRAGEHDLAARLDARKMPFTFIAGISDAAPREAARAFERGDMARAKDLARAVIRAWEVADLDVPAVTQMRALVREVPP